MRVPAALASAVLAALPSLAEACPSCAGNDGGSAQRDLLLGSMIVIPFLIAGLVIRVLRSDELKD